MKKADRELITRWMDVSDILDNKISDELIQEYTTLFLDVFDVIVDTADADHLLGNLLKRIANCMPADQDRNGNIL